MADYPSKHSGTTIDNAVDKINKITDAQISFLAAANNAKNGLFYKDANGNFSVIPLSTPPSANGALYIENGNIKIGQIPLGYQAPTNGKKAIITAVYDKASSIKTNSGGTKAVDNLEIHAVIYGDVTQLRIEFTMPKDAKALKGNFGDVCIAQINSKATQFSVLQLAVKKLIPLCNGLLHPGGGRQAFGYISSGSGNIYMSASSSELKAGDKVILGTTFISS